MFRFALPAGMLLLFAAGHAAAAAGPAAVAGHPAVADRLGGAPAASDDAPGIHPAAWFLLGMIATFTVAGDDSESD